MPAAGLHLSERQQQLLQLLSQGKSNKEIAFELNITEGSVKQQLFSLYRKLGVTSRTKAIVQAAESLGRPAPAHSSEQDGAYLWKLVTSVAIQPLNYPSKQAAAIAAFDRALGRLRSQVERFAALLDCHLMIAPGGELLACFGTPLSHLDDPARALCLARLVAQWHKRQACPELELGIGVATAAEIVPESSSPPVHAESFKLARQLAGSCRNGEILATEICCRLAGPLYPYQAVPDKLSPAIGTLLLPAEEDIDPAMLARHNPLPFIAEVIERFRQRRQADWISIESWPPSAGVRLMDAVAVHFEAAQVPVLRLRLPTARNPAEMAANLAAQIELFANPADAGQPPEPRFGHSPLGSLKALGMRGPHAVFIYGVNSLARLMELLEMHGIQAISGLPLSIVGMHMHEDADAYVAARLLGNSPISAGNSRVFKLSLGSKPSAPNELDADLMTLIDILSPAARQMVRQLVEYGSISYEAAGKHARELLSSGLFVDQDGAIACRDEETQNTLFAHLVRDFRPA